MQTCDLHLTLAFLGDLAIGSAAELAAAWQRACAGTSLSALEFSGLQRWGGRRAVWVAEFHPAADWVRVVEQLIELLVPRGIELDVKAFRPHVTLWRGDQRGRAMPLFKWPAAQLQFDRLVLMARGDAASDARYRIVHQLS